MDKASLLRYQHNQRRKKKAMSQANGQLVPLTEEQMAQFPYLKIVLVPTQVVNGQQGFGIELESSQTPDGKMSILQNWVLCMEMFKGGEQALMRHHKELLAKTVSSGIVAAPADALNRLPKLPDSR